jgi:hypothetical protein
MRALIVGFLGRLNSGDELMLAQHCKVLRRLGFNEIDLHTEFPHNLVPPYPLCYRPLTYQLVLIGGGALPIGFGLHIATREKLQGGAKIVMSSVNLPLEFHPTYYRLLRTLCDIILTRAKDESDQLRTELPIHFLQDVATTYEPMASNGSQGLAVVVREHKTMVCNFAPDDPFDVLVLSDGDRGVSQRYAKQFGAPLIDLSTSSAEQHVDRIARYARVLTLGRYHAAVYAAMLGKDYVYLFPNYYQQLLDLDLGVRGRVSWEQIKSCAVLHRDRTKAGLPSDRLAEYGRATLAQYTEAFSEVLCK